MKAVTGTWIPDSDPPAWTFDCPTCDRIVEDRGHTLQWSTFRYFCSSSRLLAMAPGVEQIATTVDRRKTVIGKWHSNSHQMRWEFACDCSPNYHHLLSLFVTEAVCPHCDVRGERPVSDLRVVLPNAAPAVDVHALPHLPSIVDTCGSPHPTRPDVSCDRHKGHGLEHRSGTSTHVTHTWD